jgi:hypothetical protein
MICSGVNHFLPIKAPFSQVFSYYTWSDLKGAGHRRLLCGRTRIGSHFLRPIIAFSARKGWQHG